MSWKSQISGTFGSVDLIFSGHPSDAERAIDLLKICHQNGVSLQDLISEVTRYLNNNKASTQHIQDQLECIRLKFEPWLN